MNKSPIAKFQNFMGQIESRERRRFGIHCSSFSFLEQRNPPAKKKKKKKHQWPLLDPIISPNASQNADQMVHYKSSIDLTHCAPTIRLWCQEKPSPTGQQWQDCWCPNPIKLGANFYLHTRSQSQEDKD